MTIKPAQPLRPGTRYTVTVSGAVDKGENDLIPHTWSFTTLQQAAGHWKFDEGSGDTTADSSGFNHDASLNETAAWIAGKNGGAVSNVLRRVRSPLDRPAKRRHDAGPRSAGPVSDHHRKNHRKNHRTFSRPGLGEPRRVSRRLRCTPGSLGTRTPASPCGPTRTSCRPARTACAGRSTAPGGVPRIRDVPWTCPERGVRSRNRRFSTSWH